jgi:hypothetical protein
VKGEGLNLEQSPFDQSRDSIQPARPEPNAPRTVASREVQESSFHRSSNLVPPATLKNPNFHLVSGVNLVRSRRIGPEQAAAIQTAFIAYRTGLAGLHPHLGPTINQHLLFHLSDLVELVGPLVALAAWVGERLNKRLKDISRNDHEGLSCFPSCLPRFRF